MPVLLGLVAVGNRVLVEHFDGTYANCAPAQLDVVAKKVLTKASASNESKLSFTVESHTVHTLLGNGPGLIFLAVASHDMSRGVAFTFLENLRRRFEAMFGPADQLPEPWKVAIEMKPVLEALVAGLNRVPGEPVDLKTQQCKAVVAEAKDVMMHNIDKVIDRGEKMDSLLNKSEDLALCSSSFKSSAKNAARQLWWESVKQKMMFAGFGLLAVVVLVILVCGPTLASCKSTGNKG